MNPMNPNIQSMKAEVEQTAVQTGEATLKDTTPEAIRLKMWEIDNTEKLPREEKEKQHDAAVIDWLCARGVFFKWHERETFASSLYFDAVRKRLFRIQADTFVAWLAEVLGMNKGSRKFKARHEAIQTESLSERTAPVEPSIYWEHREGKIYLSNGPGAIVRISKDTVEMVDNGTDGVLFLPEHSLPPWRLDLKNAQNPFETCALFKSMTCVHEHGRLLFTLWAISLPANPQNKPPLVVVGDCGSGKTRSILGIFELYGLPPRATTIKKRNGEDDFKVCLNAGGLILVDNLDQKNDWLADILASAATGVGSQQRELYTTDTVLSLKTKAWVALSSVNSYFAADPGLADRLLVVRLTRRARGDTKGDPLSKEILEARSAALSWLAIMHQRALSDTQPTPADLNARHPDFAVYAVKLGRAMGLGPQAEDALRAAEADKSHFQVENDTIGNALLSFMQQWKIEWGGTAADLFEAIDGGDSQAWGHLTVKGLSSRIKFIWPHLENVFRAEKRKGHGGVWRYTFQPPENAPTDEAVDIAPPDDGAVEV